MRIALFIGCLLVSALAVGAFIRAVVRICRHLAAGRPSPGRFERPAIRLQTALVEIVSHSGFRSRPVAKVAHWAVMVSFVILVPTLAVAYGQILDPHASLPLVGSWAPWNWLVEAMSWAGLVGVVILFTVRLRHREGDLDETRDRRRARFLGSSHWQAYFVEAVIAAVIVCVLTMHALESALAEQGDDVAVARLRYPTTAWAGSLLAHATTESLELGLSIVAAAKILISMTWMAVVATWLTMGVAWHRFLAFVNVFTRREGEGGKALGAAAPMLIDGEPFDLRTIDAIPDDAAFGVTTIDQFGWKGLLDFSSCTECGRCQDVCPAWDTGKPLSPKLLMLGLRTQAAAAAGVAHPASESLILALARSGMAGSDPAGGADASLVGDVFSADALWACTTCGACVDQCPVDIEHVDHILNLRRGAVMTAAEFPEELGPVFQALETRSNPWGMPPRTRLDWATPLDVPIPVVGRDVGSLQEVDYLLWVGCAGAFDEKGRRTTAALTELLHLAGVSFAVLGEGENCCGDPARRAGNEAVYQELALRNIEHLTALGADRILVTCAHCFNALAREYSQFGASFTVVHHTQLLNRLVREGRLPLAPPDDPTDATTLTFHDPCYLARHNSVVDAPRELLTQLPGAELIEMERSGRDAYCCGAGGGRMWEEESLGTRINETRLGQAIETGAPVVATACPYCTVMLSDAADSVQEAPQVRDVALLVLDAARRARNNKKVPTP